MRKQKTSGAYFLANFSVSLMKFSMLPHSVGVFKLILNLFYTINI